MPGTLAHEAGACIIPSLQETDSEKCSDVPKETQLVVGGAEV